MLDYRRLLLVLCLVLCVLPMAHAATLKNPPGSFLMQPVSDVNGLIDQMQQNPKVAARFAKHFGMSSAELITYFRQNLRVSTLPATGRHTEYFVDKNGRVISHVKQIKSGTLVLVSSDGTPVMDLKCGNPLTKKLPKAVAKAKPRIETKVAQATQELTPPVVESKPELQPQPAPAPPSLLPPAPVIQPDVVTQVLAARPQEVTFSPNIGRAAALLLPLLGAAAIASNNHSTPAAVPEPSSLVVLLTGMAGFAASRRWRR